MLIQLLNCSVVSSDSGVVSALVVFSFPASTFGFVVVIVLVVSGYKTFIQILHVYYG
jgi:hypothetical protein